MSAINEVTENLVNEEVIEEGIGLLETIDKKSFGIGTLVGTVVTGVTMFVAHKLRLGERVGNFFGNLRKKKNSEEVMDVENESTEKE